jgi:hypothetical protein
MGELNPAQGREDFDAPFLLCLPASGVRMPKKYNKVVFHASVLNDPGGV